MIGTLVMKELKKTHLWAFLHSDYKKFADNIVKKINQKLFTKNIEIIPFNPIYPSSEVWYPFYCGDDYFRKCSGISIFVSQYYCMKNISIRSFNGFHFPVFVKYLRLSILRQ